MNRRAALRTLAAGVGAAASALWVDNLRALTTDVALRTHLLTRAAQAGTTWTPKVLDAHQLETVGALVELIIPTTDTPGARTALVDRYVDGVLQAAPRADRDQFLAGLKWLDDRSRTHFRANFVSARPADQAELLTEISAAGAASAPTRGQQFFTAIKTMTIAGYYTTEIGLRRELGDDGRMVLAEFEGCTHPEHQ